MLNHLWHAFWLLIASSATAKVWPLPLPETTATPMPMPMPTAMTTTGYATNKLNADDWQHVNKTCLSANCSGSDVAGVNLQHLFHIERYMRHEIDPCVDFHAYACGNWAHVHSTTTEQSAMAMGGRRQNERYVTLFERLLRDRRDRLHAEPVFGKLLHYYTTCRDSEVRHGKLQLAGYIRRIMAHAQQRQQQHRRPTTLARNMTPPHWLELVARVGRYGYSGHFIQIDVKQQNATAHQIIIQPHNAALKANLSAEVYAALANYTHLSHAALTAEFTRLETELAAIVNATTPYVDYDTYVCYCFRELVAIVGDVDWQRMLSLQFGGRFDAHHKLLVDNVASIRQLVRYLNQADPKLLAVYTLTRFLNYLQALPQNPLNSAANAYNCVRHMRKTLYLAMNYAYERAYYVEQRANSELVINTVFAELKREFSRTLSANAMQLPLGIVDAMQAKLAGMRINIGNMPINATDAFYAECVAHLRVGDNFYENHLQSLLHYYTHLAALEHAHAQDKALWYTFNHHTPNMLDEIDATPYFYCLSNIIIIPYAYLQLPFFDAHFWPALLYGDLANTLGHELLHAFDTYFVDYDAAGNMRDYSTQLEQNAVYNARLQCLNDSSVLYVNERIADISGTRLALNTYMRSPSQRHSNGKLYFLQFAQFFCGDDSDVYHDAGSKRLNYTLAQMPEFAEVFGCASGSPMNPFERCELW